MLSKILYFLSTFFLLSFFSFADAKKSSEDDKVDIGGMIMHHILDDYGYEIMHGVVIPLPVILYSNETGFDIFSSSKLFDEDHVALSEGYKGYYYDHGHIKSIDSSRSFYDFSITKNVAFLFLNASLIVFIFLNVARAYGSKISAPSGLQSFFEPIILFVRDNIVKPNIGKHYEKYLPYMLTLFFFIFFGNILGLLPAAANLTGNIAVTMILAVLTFLIIFLINEL